MTYLSTLSFRIVVITMITMGYVDTSRAEISFEDVAGRRVDMALPAKRILLAAPSWYSALAILDKEAAKRIVGIAGNLGDPLPETEQELSDKPRVGSIVSRTFSIEKALELKPDIVISARQSVQQSPSVENAFAKAGVPVVYIDFSYDPVRNTEISFKVLGIVLGAEDRAAEFIDLYHRHVSRITDRLERPGVTRPKLLIMSRGPGVPCCFASPDGRVTDYFNGLGVENIAGAKKPGQLGSPAVQLSLEYIIERDPDVFVAIDPFPDSRSMFGLPRSLAHGVAALQEVRQEPGFRDLAAMRGGRVHAIDFYLLTSPLSFVAFEALAKWVHPELFADIDPQATLDEINRRFLKTPLKGPFWVSLDPAADRASSRRP